jgi:hypothetical protein
MFVSTTERLSNLCARQSMFNAEVTGSVPNRQAPA